MSEKKTPKKVESTAAVITTGITMVATVIPLVKPAIDAIHDYADKTIEERKNLITVPNLYSKDFPLTVEQAEQLLNSYGLKAIFVKISLADANVRYRKYFNSQVVESRPKAKQKVEPGASVLVKYITQEVIDESRRLFEEAENRKIEQLCEKNIKRSKQKENAKRVVSNITDMAKRGAEKIPLAFHKNDIEENSKK